MYVPHPSLLLLIHIHILGQFCELKPCHHGEVMVLYLAHADALWVGIHPTLKVQRTVPPQFTRSHVLYDHQLPCIASTFPIKV